MKNTIFLNPLLPNIQYTGVCIGYQCTEYLSSITLWILNMIVADPDPVSVWDDGSQVGGGGHPTPVLSAQRRVPASAVHSRWNVR